MRRLSLILLIFLAKLSAAQELLITPTPIATNIEAPVAVTHAGDGSDRLFIVQRIGRILVWEDGVVLAEPFLDISERVGCCGERGLLGLAFHPDFADNGLFYVNYTDLNFDTTVSRFRAEAGAAVALPGSEEIVLTVEQPASNHNGGHLAFGPDGYLYIGLGDGGGAGDPGNLAQDRLSLLGKMLRIDVDGGSPYAIPADNPFAFDDFTLDEIWALGLRNPFRYSFDRITGDLYIADVGQDAFEEVHVHRANTAGGENYGWRLMEGSACFNPASGCNDGSLTLPAFDYAHAGDRCSITGGFVYRGARIPALTGQYVYGDFCSGEILAAQLSDSGWQQSVLLDSGFEISSFGETEGGELLVVDINGGIYQLQAPLVISPGSGSYLQAQTIDLALILRNNSPVSSLTLSIDGIDVTALFEQCATNADLATDGQSWRCPGLPLAELEPGNYRLDAEIGLISGQTVTAAVDWEIIGE